MTSPLSDAELLVQRRRKKGEAKDCVNHLAAISRESKAKIVKVADALNISQAAATELLLASVEVDPNGRPAFWTDPLPGDAQEALPMTG